METPIYFPYFLRDFPFPSKQADPMDRTASRSPSSSAWERIHGKSMGNSTRDLDIHGFFRWKIDGTSNFYMIFPRKTWVCLRISVQTSQFNGLEHRWCGCPLFVRQATWPLEGLMGPDAGLWLKNYVQRESPKIDGTVNSQLIKKIWINIDYQSKNINHQWFHHWFPFFLVSTNNSTMKHLKSSPENQEASPTIASSAPQRKPRAGAWR